MDDKVIEEMRDAIWSARQDAPQGDYTLKMRLSYDEATRAAQACASIVQKRIEGLTAALVDIAELEAVGKSAAHLGDIARAALSPVGVTEA